MGFVFIGIFVFKVDQMLFVVIWKKLYYYKIFINIFKVKIYYSCFISQII